jgi:hypothetical protein
VYCPRMGKEIDQKQSSSNTRDGGLATRLRRKRLAVLHRDTRLLKVEDGGRGLRSNSVKELPLRKVLCRSKSPG